MNQQHINQHLDKQTFLDCHSTIRSWLEYQRSQGLKAVRTSARWGFELVNSNGEFFAMINEIEFNYFEGLS